MIQGVPDYAYIPIQSSLGTFLASVQNLPTGVQQVLQQAMTVIEQRFRDTDERIRQSNYRITRQGAGFSETIGISGSTQQAYNWSMVNLPVGGTTQATWTFRTAESDSQYGVLCGLNGPGTLPTVLKGTAGVTLQWASATPTGMRADLLLFR